MYTTREHGTGHLFCVPPSFVLIDKKKKKKKKKKCCYKEQTAR